MLLSEPRGRLADDDETWFEIKYDGYRMLAQAEGSEVFLKTRNGADASAWFPEVGAGLQGFKLPLGTVVDGEVCVLDDIGRSNFDAVHRRARARRWVEGMPAAVYCVFDVLHSGGEDLRGLELSERQKVLEDLVHENRDSIMRVTGVRGVGKWLYQQAVLLGLEGIVRKRLAAPYTPGARTGDWVKQKVPGAVPPQRFSRSKRPAT